MMLTRRTPLGTSFQLLYIRFVAVDDANEKNKKLLAVYVHTSASLCPHTLLRQTTPQCPVYTHALILPAQMHIPSLTLALSLL